MTGPIPAHEWRPLHSATTTLLGGPTTALRLLQAVQAYRRHGLDTAIPTRCHDLGYPAWQHKDVLLLALAGLTPDEITTRHARSTLPDRDALRILAALTGRGAPPATPRRPKRKLSTCVA